MPQLPKGEKGDETQSTISQALEIQKRLKGRYHPYGGRIAPSFSVDPDEAVLNQFSRSGVFAEQTKEGLEALPALIPSLYASARSASPCTPAILAMAWVTSASFATVGQRMGAARWKYGEAMVKLQDALQDPRTAMADDALFTVLLMLIIEVSRPFTYLLCFSCWWI